MGIKLYFPSFVSIVPAFNKAEPYPVEVDNGIAVIWLMF
jgi:hypothetical protein